MTASMTEFASADRGFSLISNRKLLALYFAMMECRRIAEGSKGKGRRASADSIFGHEAAAVGAAIDLLADDTIASILRPEAALKAINPLASFAPELALAARAVVMVAGTNPGRRTKPADPLRASRPPGNFDKASHL